jgi:hypothetical protein
LNKVTANGMLLFKETFQEKRLVELKQIKIVESYMIKNQSAF